MAKRHCATKSGVLRLYHEGQEYLLDSSGTDLPEELADSIRTHVNVVVEESLPTPKPKNRAEKEEA